MINWYKQSKFESSEYSNNRYNIGPYRNLTLLGCGESGCAYFDSVTNHVIKQTTSKSEADRASSLINYSYSFFPEIYHVIDYEGSWLIEKEEIDSLSSDEMEMLDVVQYALEEVNYNWDDFLESVKDSLEFSSFDPELDYKRAIIIGNKLLDLISSVEEMGGLPGEIRGDNIGIRSDQYVVRDTDV